MKIITLLSAATLVACNLDVGDLNNPGLDELENHPTVAAVSSASTGLLVGNRRNVASENGYISQLGILGREAYCFDAADPRFTNELIIGTLNHGSPFGGNFWTGPYTNIQLGNIVLHALDKLTDMPEADKAAIRGFTKTIQALDLLEVINTHDTNGAVVDTDHPIDQLGAIVDKDTTFATIVQLLDGALPDLDAAGDAFPFLMSSGYTGFDTPKDFRKFNRAIRARVAVYTKKYADALTALSMSFMNDMPMAQADLDVGVYHSFSTKSGDTTNSLLNPNIFAHPALVTDAEKNGTTVDARVTRKITDAPKPGSVQGLSSDKAFTMYASPSSPVPIIRNEELILIEAEAKFFTGDVPGALTALNAVRQLSGGLQKIAGTPSEAMFVMDLLYERRYSLMFEGHRWIDLRRFNVPLPLDKPDHTANVRYPIPLQECNARPDEPRCDLGST